MQASDALLPFPSAWPMPAAIASGLDCGNDNDAPRTGFIQIDHDLQVSAVCITTDNPVFVESGLDVRFNLRHKSILQDRPNLW